MRNERVDVVPSFVLRQFISIAFFALLFSVCKRAKQQQLNITLWLCLCFSLHSAYCNRSQKFGRAQRKCAGERVCFRQSNLVRVRWLLFFCSSFCFSLLFHFFFFFLIYTFGLCKNCTCDGYVSFVCIHFTYKIIYHCDVSLSLFIYRVRVEKRRFLSLYSPFIESNVISCRLLFIFLFTFSSSFSSSFNALILFLFFSFEIFTCLFKPQKTKSVWKLWMKCLLWYDHNK